MMALHLYHGPDGLPRVFFFIYIGLVAGVPSVPYLGGLCNLFLLYYVSLITTLSDYL